MVRLSERETCKLLELYRQNECLWNANHIINLQNRQVKQMKYEAIAREMNIENFPALAVRNKIKSLRSTYKQELKKIKRLSKEGFEDFRTHLKWFSTMDSIFKMQENSESPADNQSLENGEHTPTEIFPDDSQYELQTGSSVEIASATVSSAPSIPSESETEQSVKSISVPETIALTPEIQNVRSLSSSDFYSITPEVLPVSDSKVVKVTQDNLADKTASTSETITVTSGTQQEVKFVSDSAVATVPSGIPTPNSITYSAVTTVPSGIQTTKSVSDSAVTTVPSGIPIAKTASTPKLFALIPDIQTSHSISSPRLITVSAENNQNVRYVSGSPGITLAPEIQQRVKQVSTDETLFNRKRRHEEVSSTDSNAEVRQISNTRTVIGDFSDRSEDEMDVFGHFVALNLKKMTMQSALSAQSEILSVLTRHRLNDSATNLPSKQTFPCIVTNGGSPRQNPAVLQKRFSKS